MTILDKSDVATRLPAQDLERARRFYEEKLGLKPVEERPGGLLYHCGGGYFALFQSTGKPSGAHTQMAWSVADLAATVAELRARGVAFEEYDSPVTTVYGIATIAATIPARAPGRRPSRFKDSEGNLLGIGQPTR